VQLVSHHVWRQAWILSQLDMLEEARKDLLTQLQQLISSHPYTPIIESLPVKSLIWTETLISVIGSVERFSNYAQFRAYMGWFPKVKQSGISVHSSALADNGVRLGRKVFGQMARVLITPNVRETPFRIYYDKLVNRGKKPISALGHVSAKLANVLYECLKTMTLYDEMKHRKQMGLLIEENTTSTTQIEIKDAQIDALEVVNSPSDVSATP
jgi:hypothetical protein